MIDRRGRVVCECHANRSRRRQFAHSVTHWNNSDYDAAINAIAAAMDDAARVYSVSKKTVWVGLMPCRLRHIRNLQHNICLGTASLSDINAPVIPMPCDVTSRNQLFAFCEKDDGIQIRPPPTRTRLHSLQTRSSSERKCS